MQILLGLLLVFVVVGLISGVLMFWSLTIPKLGNNSNESPLVSIIIPARNEAKRLPVLLVSLNQQTYENFEVIIVDDASSDETVEIAKGFGVSVIQNEPVAEMTSGKSTACATGSRYALGEWLLFLDADVQFTDKNSLEKLLSAFTEQRSKGILSVQPYHTMKKTYEYLSAVFNIVVLTGVNVFTVWKDKFETAGSFGPCILCDKEGYQLSGGHEAVKDSIMDDFALSELFIENKLPVRNFGGKGIINLRMYGEGFGYLVEGWTKNLGTASQSTHGFIMLLINLWICGSFVALGLPFLALVNGISMFLFIGIIVYLLYAVHVALLASRAGDFPKWIFVFFPILFLFFTLIFIYSLYRTRIVKSVMWKGRKIKV